VRKKEGGLTEKGTQEGYRQEGESAVCTHQEEEYAQLGNQKGGGQRKIQRREKKKKKYVPRKKSEGCKVIS